MDSFQTSIRTSNKALAAAADFQPPRQSRKRGQSLLEYVLLVGLLSVVTLAYVNFYGKEVLGGGLRQLKGVMGACISHGTTCPP